MIQQRISDDIQQYTHEPLLLTDNALIGHINWNADGLIPTVVQEKDTNIVLMLAWMNKEALVRTLLTRQGTYFSRSRQKLWVKGETSGHWQHVHQVLLDCDADTILLIVDQVGPACHRDTHSCFDGGTIPLLAPSE